jgi:hypothetical protein
VDPSVISARAFPCDASAPLRLQIDRYDPCIATGEGVEHLLLGACGRSLRVDVVSGTVLAGPVVLEPTVCLDRLDFQVAAVRTLAGILSREPVAAVTDTRLPRLVLALRALDARREGASLREIASGIFGQTDWPGDGDHIKSRARRLVRLSEILVRAGPRGVLAYQI